MGEELVVKRWETRWRGTQRRGQRWYDLRATERGQGLFVDGASSYPGRKTLPRECGDLYGKIEEGGAKREVRGHVGSVRWRPKTECLILGDGVPVGGDVGEKLTAV